MDVGPIKATTLIEVEAVEEEDGIEEEEEVVADAGEVEEEVEGLPPRHRRPRLAHLPYVSSRY